MPKFLVEREIPGIGGWSVGHDRLYCVYIAPGPELIEKHAAWGGFPCSRVAEVRALMDLTTAEQRS